MKYLDRFGFRVFIFFIFLFSVSKLSSSEWDVEVLDNPSPGYIGFGWKSDSTFNLMDNYGIFPFKRTNSNNLLPFKLLSNGLWISYGQKKFYLMNQDFQLVDSIPFPTGYNIDIHDVNVLANGHYLLLCMEERVKDLSGVVEGGKTNARLISAVLVETDRTGAIYWQWKALDHFAVTDGTSDVDLTQNAIDFTHANSFLEDSDGNILISFRFFDEITKIEKSTGNIIWRFGGKLCKNNQFKYLNDTIDGFYGFSHQHSINLLPNGNILLFDNGNLKPNQYSRAVEYQLNTTAKTALKVWEYRPDPDVYVFSMGSARRLLNGNTMVSFGTMKYNTKVIEVKPDNTIAFKLTYLGDKSQLFFNATRYITKMDAVGKQFNNIGNYSFNDVNFTTGVDIQVNNLSGNGYVSVEKHKYLPVNAQFSDSIFTSILPMRWVLNAQNITSINGIMSFNTQTISGISNPDKIVVYARNKESQGIFQPLNTTYNAGTKTISATISSLGEYLLVSYKLSKPVLVFPTNNQLKIMTNTILKWQKLSGITSYKLQLSKSSNMANTIIDTTISANNISFNLTNLNYSTNYFWRIRGINTKDTSEWSDTFMFTTIEDKIFVPIPISPLNNSITFKNNDTLKWSLVPSATSYILQISDDETFISGSQKSLIWKFTTCIDKPILELPQNQSINLPINGFLKCKNVDGAEKYQFRLSSNQDFNSILIDSISNSNQINFKELDYNKNYYWKSRAINNLDTSNWSEFWTLSTLLPKPVLVYPENNQKGISKSNLLTWKSDIPQAVYDIQISENEDFSNNLIDSSKISLTNFELKSFEYNKKYFWHIRQYNGNRISEWSDTWKFTSEMEVPTLVSPENNQVEVPISITFNWSDKNSYQSYRLQISVENSFSTKILDELLENTSEYKFPAENSKTYFWRLKSETNDNFSSWSPVFKFTTKSISNVKQLTENEISIYPNPASDFIEISIPDNANHTLKGVVENVQENVQIFNALGIIVAKTPSSVVSGQNSTSDVIRMDISNLPAGIYFIKIGAKVEKLILVD
jgi:hypothetical protein